MRMKNLFMLLSASCLLLSITVCSDDTENGGKKRNVNPVTALNIQNARLIYGVEQSPAMRSTRSGNDESNNGYYKITTEEEKEEIKPITNIGETADAKIRIYGMDNINEDYMLVNMDEINTIWYFDPDGNHPSNEITYTGSYIISKKTGEILNPDNIIRGLDMSYLGSFYASYCDDKYCYVTGARSLYKIDLDSYSVEQMYQGALYTRILPDGTFFVHMRHTRENMQNPNYKGCNYYGNLKTGVVNELPPNYLAVNGCNERELIVIDPHVEYHIEDGYGGYYDERFMDFYTLRNGELTKNDYHINTYGRYHNRQVMGHSSFASGKLVICTVDIDDRNNLSLLNYNLEKNEISELYDNIIDGYTSGGDYLNPARPLDFFPKIISNGISSYNMSYYDGSVGMVITDHRDFSQKRIKEIQGYHISAITGGKDNTITFIGQTYDQNNYWGIGKQCMGEIYPNGESKILKEYDVDDNEPMSGFIIQLK